MPADRPCDGGVLRGAAAAPAVDQARILRPPENAPRPGGRRLGAHRRGHHRRNVAERRVRPHNHGAVGPGGRREHHGHNAAAGLQHRPPASGLGGLERALDALGRGLGRGARGFQAYFLDADGGAHDPQRGGPQTQHRLPPPQRRHQLGQPAQPHRLGHRLGLRQKPATMAADGGELKGVEGAYRLPFGGWHAILAVCHLGAALTIIVHAGAADRRWRVPVDVLYNQWDVPGGEGGDECGGDAGPCVVSLRRRRLDAELAVWLIVPFFSIVSGLHHALAAASLYGAAGCFGPPSAGRHRNRRWLQLHATWLKLTTPTGTRTEVWLTPPDSAGGAATGEASGWYAASVLDGVVWVRWADYAVSATLMLLVNAVLWVSPPDVQSLVLWAAVQTLIIAAGAGSEVAAVASRPGAASTLFWSTVAPFAGVWAAQLYVFYVAVDADDGANPPAVVYLFLFGLLAGFSAFPIIHGLKLRALRRAGGNDAARLAANLTAEARYAGLSFSVKFPLLLAYWAGNVNRDATTTFAAPWGPVYHNGSAVNASGQTSGGTDDADTEVFMAFGVGAGVAILLSLLLLCASPPRPADLYRGTRPSNSYELRQGLL